MLQNEELVIGLVSISDRAATGIYEDKGIPALQEWPVSYTHLDVYKRQK